MEKPAPAIQPLYEAWFECGCTKIAPRRELVEYCPIHGDDREGLVKYTPYEGAQRVKIGDCLKTGPEACWQVDTFSGHLTGAQSPQNSMITSV